MKMNKKIVIGLAIIAAFMMLVVPLVVIVDDSGSDAATTTPGKPIRTVKGIGQVDMAMQIHGITAATESIAISNVDLGSKLTVTVTKGTDYNTYAIAGTLKVLSSFNPESPVYKMLTSWGSYESSSYALIIGQATGTDDSITKYVINTSATEVPTSIPEDQDSKITTFASIDAFNTGTYYMWTSTETGAKPVAALTFNLSAGQSSDVGEVTYVFPENFVLSGSIVSGTDSISFVNVKADSNKMTVKIDANGIQIEGGVTKNADSDATMAVAGSVKLSNALTIGEGVVFSGDLDLNSKTVTNNGTISVATVEQLTKAVGIGGNVSLTADISPTSPIDIASGKTVTLDLGGKTIASSSTGKALNNFGTLTLQNGTISGPDTSYSVVKNFAGATLTINDLTVTGSPDTFGYIAVKQDDQVSEGGAVGTGGLITINSGTFTAGQAVQAWGTVIINGGTFNGRVTAWGYPGDNAGEVTINGGTFNAPIETYTWYSGSAAPTNTPNITINGGNFGSSSISLIHRNQGTIAAPTTPMYIFIKNGVSISSSASCCISGSTGAKHYATLQDALAAATEGATIELLADCTYTASEKTAFASVPLTVNGNNKKITMSATLVNLTRNTTFNNVSFVANSIKNNLFDIATSNTVNVTFDGCSFSGNAQQGAEMNFIQAPGYGSDNFKGRLTVNDCTFDNSGENFNRDIRVVLTGEGTVIVTDCTFSSLGNDQDWPVKITGGKFADCTMTGNKLSNGSQLYSVVSDSALVLTADAPVAKIGDVGYATLADALAAATSGKTIDLLSDVTVESNESFTVISGVTLSVPTTLTLSVVGTLNVSGTLNNLGTVDVSGILKDAFVADATAKQIDNKGQINVLSGGQLKVGYQPAAAGINIDGKINIAAGGKFVNRVSAGENTVVGTSADSAMVTLNTGSIDIDAKSVGGAVAYTLNANSTATAGSFLLKSGDTVTIDGTLTTNAFTIPAGVTVTVNGEINVPQTDTLTLGGTIALGETGKLVGKGTVDFSAAASNSIVITAAQGATLTVTLDGSTPETATAKKQYSAMIVDNIVAGAEGFTVTKGSVVIKGYYTTDDTGKITIPATDLDGNKNVAYISGSVDSGVVIDVAGEATLEVATGSSLTFEADSALVGKVTVSVGSGAEIVYEEGSVVNGAVIEVTTREKEGGVIEVTVIVTLRTENGDKLMLYYEGEYCEVVFLEAFEGDSFVDVLANVGVEPVKSRVSFDGWYNVLNEKVTSDMTVGAVAPTLTAKFTETPREGVTPHTPSIEPTVITVDETSGYDNTTMLVAAVAMLVVAIFVLGYVVIVKRK